jgi:hypothetical protein
MLEKNDPGRRSGIQAISAELRAMRAQPPGILATQLEADAVAGGGAASGWKRSTRGEIHKNLPASCRPCLIG